MTTRNAGIRKTIEILLKKVETLENQSFAQKLAIDELESKLQQAETLIKQVRDNPFGSVSISPLPQPLPTWHTCTPSSPDPAGSVFCTSCGSYMYGMTYTSSWIATNSTTANSSSTGEDILDLDISWVIPDEPTK